MFRADFIKSRKVYEQLGQYDYQNPDYTDDITECTGVGKNGENWVYFGQTKAGTEILDGIGIMVWERGATPICIYSNCICEGYWKDDLRNGPCRFIFPSGDCYVGENKDNKFHGHGTQYFTNGDKYSGDFINDKGHGKGTFYKADGTKELREYRNGNLIK